MKQGHAKRQLGGKESNKKAERMYQEMGMDYWLAQTEEVLKRM